jgi:hypothetical protein
LPVVDAGCGAATITPVALYGPVNPVMPPAIAARALAAHNRERGKYGEAPLVWDEALARGALDWAQELARTGKFDHAPAARRKRAGENLFMGTAGAFSIDAMIGQFIAEREDFQPGTFPYVTRDGNWHNVAHYTQIVWRGTRRVGCAIARRGVMTCWCVAIGLRAISLDRGCRKV